uniref:NodB homology domain-containing protein n=1 Tax=Bombyx mori TaxID=7091 RepID=A0A8R2QXA7_BOMMO|nr:uncharacterized protein LOC101740429 isoform X3 [Bombyx mori]
MEYYEADPEDVGVIDDHFIQDDVERGKRQIRYYLKNGYKPPLKNWAIAKPVRLVDQQARPSYNQNSQSQRYQPTYNNNYNNPGRLYFSYDSNRHSTANPLVSYQESQTERPFKPSLPDPAHQKHVHNPINTVTNLITKSPPISSLSSNNNPFTSLNGGFYNNSPRPNHEQIQSHYITSLHHINDGLYHDSSILPSTVVTGKPVPVSTSERLQSTYRPKSNKSQSQQSENKNESEHTHKQPQEEEYDEEGSSEENQESSSEEYDDDDFKHDFPEPPYEFTHPSNKYAEIENPFANPNFDFDAFLSKISNGQYTPAPKVIPKIVNSAVGSSSPANVGSVLPSSTLNYQGMSTPKPFTPDNSFTTQYKDKNSEFQPVIKQSQLYDQFQSPKPSLQSYSQQQQQQHNYNENVYTKAQQTAGTPLDAIRPKLKPPNFKDDRQLPITYSFTTPNSIDQTKLKEENQRIVAVTPKPHLFASGTGGPLILSNSKQQYINLEHFTEPQNRFSVTTRPYFATSVKPYEAHVKSTQKPLTTITNEQLSALQQYWKNNPTANPLSVQSVTIRPGSSPNIAQFETFFGETIKSSTNPPVFNQNTFTSLGREQFITTVKPATKRRPIPKPSPEMNDYYYDDEDEQYYYEPVVKPKYMPSTEIKPQRPPLAQNYKEYDDSYEDSREETATVKPLQKVTQRPTKYYTIKPETTTKNHNDVSAPIKSFSNNENNKIPIPVLVEYANPTSSVLMRPDVSNYEIIHHHTRNRTIHLKKPISNESGPYTSAPPKYLNQTTLRPYTVRHRLAKPTTVPETSKQNHTQNRVRMRHPNIVAQKLTTPRDSYNQETRFTKINHDGKTNSLEPTENLSPVSYSPSPRPKMLYNGSQAYNPDQYDPYYAVYDEDGELYKDTDYVQQYNVASVRPAVQQTYRGTPPPARRPVETYTARPVSADDYDDALIQGQISNQNQYQAPVRHSTRPTSTRGRGSAHFSTSSGSDAPLPPPNRGTPPTRSRPTLKPSTAIVSKTTEFVDIYNHPPSRPASVYPQPTPDKTAAKCRKDVCLLPDCYCGGKEIPGDLPVESVPQIVLLTFDDSVNDLNKGLYTDLFEKGRVNPNGCPITATFYVSHEWTDYSQVQNLYSAGHEMASHTISHSFGEQFSQKKWNREVAGQREILAAYGGVKLEDVRGMRAPFLSVGGNKMFKMLYDSNFTYDSSLPVYENRPPSWPYTLDYKLFHDCMIPPCPTKSYPGVWEVPMVMWQDLNGGRCSMGDACANPPEPENVYKMILKNFDRHYSTNRAPFGLFYHAAWFTQPHHKEGFIMFLDHINQMPDVWIVTNWQALQWVRDPTPISRINNFQPFQCNYQDRPKKCNNPKVCNLWHKSGVRYMRTCQPCPEVYPWTGKTGIRSSRIDNDIGE